jgi:hypothetical protein
VNVDERNANRPPSNGSGLACVPNARDIAGNGAKRCAMDVITYTRAGTVSATGHTAERHAVNAVACLCARAAGATGRNAERRVNVIAYPRARAVNAAGRCVERPSTGGRELCYVKAQGGVQETLSSVILWTTLTVPAPKQRARKDAMPSVQRQAVADYTAVALPDAGLRTALPVAVAEQRARTGAMTSVHSQTAVVCTYYISCISDVATQGVLERREY